MHVCYYRRKTWLEKVVETVSPRTVSGAADWCISNDGKEVDD